MSYEYTGPGPEQEFTPPKSKKTRNCCLLSCGGCGCLVIVMILLGVVAYYVGGNIFRASINNEAVLDALQAYSLDHGEYPPAYSVDENGKPLHSWRVLILPYFDEDVYSLFYRGPLPGEVYSQIRLDEPWDSEHNRRFHSQMPQCYGNPGVKGEGKTNYQMITGSKCLSDGPNGRTADEIRAAGHPVVLFVEAAPAVEWMKPQDLSYDDMMKNGVVSDDSAVPGLACPHNVFNVRMGTTGLSTWETNLYTKNPHAGNQSDNYIRLEQLYEYATLDTDITVHDNEVLPNGNAGDNPDDPFADEASP